MMDSLDAEEAGEPAGRLPVAPLKMACFPCSAPSCGMVYETACRMRRWIAQGFSGRIFVWSGRSEGRTGTLYPYL